MPIAVVRDIPGVTQDRYEAVRREAGVDESRPAGLVLHAAGPSADGWRVVEVWESREAYEAFDRDQLRPAVVRVVGENAPVPRTEVTTLHALVR